ncbi:hypothetical protein BT93_G1932 [Corymbia citriodora subsp. variegata]|nr:hypothetical protein BT93_G1932 [Corymbia citriodora subsp. variegata]
MENEEVPSAPSTPVTPGTPGAPLFGGGPRAERSHGRKSLLRNCSGCFTVEAWSMEGGMPRSLSSSLLHPPVSLARKVGAEFIGTLILVFAGTATPIVNQKTNGSETLLGLAASSGLAVMIVILATGHISGAHLNPALTISFAALKHFPWKHVPVYIGAQAAASLCAAFALKGIFSPVMGGGVTVPSVGVGELAGIAVGATVMLNILIAGPTTGASMNPARTLGPAIAVGNYRAIWIYLTAPILGALCGAGIYSAVKLPDDGGNNHEKPSTFV